MEKKCVCECASCGKMRVWLDAICTEFQSTIDHANRPRGGMQVPFFGDFVGVALVPSVISRMEWWVKRFREALEAGDSTDDE